MLYNIIKLDSVDSTNLWARKNLSKLKNFDCVSADIQTAGHGQFERKWFSTSLNGGNIYLSIVLKPDNIEHLNELTRYTSIIVSNVLKKYNLNPDFKFPNDVLINGKKISGILAESVFIGSELKGVIVGIGINLNLDSNELKNIDIEATSVFNEINKPVDKQSFLNEFLDEFFNNYEDFVKNGIQELNYVKN